MAFATQPRRAAEASGVKVWQLCCLGNAGLAKQLFGLPPYGGLQEPAAGARGPFGATSEVCYRCFARQVLDQIIFSQVKFR